MSVYKVISTGSQGNCVIYHDTIAVDLGISFELIKPYIYDLQIILLTHEHLSDHLNLSTLKKICEERATIRIGCCEWMLPYVKDFKNVDVYQIGNEYHYGSFSLRAIKLYHDVPNCGFRIFKNDYKIFHATDTFTLEGITAKDYDLLAIEHNYDEDLIQDSIKRKNEKGEFVYENRVLNTHLSEQKARDFIFNNRKPESEVLRLHESDKN